ncbi:MAG: hypothetical protein QXI37_03555 [Thermoprotei archaeon]
MSSLFTTELSGTLSRGALRSIREVISVALMLFYIACGSHEVT